VSIASWFNDFIGRFSLAAKRCPQKLANFIDRMSSALEGETLKVLFVVDRSAALLAVDL